MKNIIKIKNWIYTLLLVLPLTVFAQEGTKQMSPDISKLSGLFYNPISNHGSYFNAPEENQVKFTISNFNTEKFYFGFSWTNYTSNTPGGSNVLNYSTQNEFMYCRILDSEGTVVVNPTLLPRAANSAGQINSYAQAVAGPRIGSFNTSGYSPLIFTPNKNDVYVIEYWRGTSTTNSTQIAGTRAVSPLFDFSVATSSALLPGRVFATKWGLATTTANNSTIPRYFTSATTSVGTPSFYVYTDKLNVLKLDFPNIVPLAYTVGANNYGVENSGDFSVDRKSVDNTDPTLAGGFNIFLNAPDATIFPYNNSTAAAPTFASPLISPVGACNVAPFNINFNVMEAGDHRIVISGSGIVSRVISLFDLTVGSKQIVWDGKDGAGTLIPTTTALNFQLSSFSDRFNIPVVDIEGNVGGINVTAIAPAGSIVSNLFWDDSTIASGTNNSTTGLSAPSHAWSVASNFGDERTINTWGYSDQKTISATSTLLCADVTLTKTVNNATPAIGSNVTFTIVASNLTAGSTATDVIVNDVLPAGYTLVSATPSIGTWNNPNWSIGNLVNGSPRTLTIVATVNASTNYTNVATISTSKPETNLNNNAAFAKVNPAAGNAISVTGLCNESGANPGYQLNNAHSGAVPPGATLVWYNNTARTGAAIANSLATVSGDYYAFYFDAAGNCYSSASAKVTVTIPSCITAVADSFTASGNIAVMGSTSIGNVLNNDTFNSTTAGTATTSNVTISVTTPAAAIIIGKPVPTLNTSTGAVAIAAGTPAGSYTIVYKICEKFTGTPCDIDTVTIVVSPPAIVAVTDTFTLNGNGNTTTSILANDKYNGGAPGSATTTVITLTKVNTWPSGFTLNANGTITVADGTVSGIYPLEYRICDQLNPLNCSTAFATITITACYLPGSLNPNAGSTLDTSVGISSLDRAGAASAWPQARKSGWIAIEAKTKGFVLNRVKFTNNVPVAQDGVTLVITTPIEGMMVYDTTNNCLKMYTTLNGTDFAWFCMTTQTCPE
ncbi:DUF11 domain-containing protein [Flavobacterium tegetincola]|uniref:DUF11 domain-containing protein n=1 Tax=Flavobacterium tegetincola TaxID=150172 RepID=UPI000414C0AB|nr:DUF11 domain-containing protein [Flavobacterium tegetincola]